MEKPFSDKRIGVLMGGSSGEREVSLRSGAGVLESLLRQGYAAAGIDVGPDADEKLRKERIDIAFIVLHGPGGEDGDIQGLLETLRIPYTGSGVAASVLSMDKELTKLVLARHGLPFPETVYIERTRSASETAAEIISRAGLPAIIKPLAEGSSLGVSVAHDGKELETQLERFKSEFGRGLAEPFITGREITVGVLGDGDAVRALPALELAPKNEFYDYEAKYTKGMTELICPARVPTDTARRAGELAVRTHLALGCHGVSRVDFMLDGEDNLFILELNSIPGMTTTSDLPEEIAAEGGDYDSLVLEILASAGLDK